MSLRSRGVFETPQVHSLPTATSSWAARLGPARSLACSASILGSWARRLDRTDNCQSDVDVELRRETRALYAALPEHWQRRIIEKTLPVAMDYLILDRSGESA